MRAAHYGLPLMLAIIGGAPLQFRPFVDLYHRALEQFEQPELPVGVHSPGYVAATDEQALDEVWPHYADDAEPDRPRARLAPDDPRASSSARPARTARCSSARRRPSPRRS